MAGAKYDFASNEVQSLTEAQRDLPEAEFLTEGEMVGNRRSNSPVEDLR